MNPTNFNSLISNIARDSANWETISKNNVQQKFCKDSHQKLQPIGRINFFRRAVYNNAALFHDQLELTLRDIEVLHSANIKNASAENLREAKIALENLKMSISLALNDGYNKLLQYSVETKDDKSQALLEASKGALENAVPGVIDSLIAAIGEQLENAKHENEKIYKNFLRDSAVLTSSTLTAGGSSSSRSNLLNSSLHPIDTAAFNELELDEVESPREDEEFLPDLERDEEINYRTTEPPSQFTAIHPDRVETLYEKGAAIVDQNYSFLQFNKVLTKGADIVRNSLAGIGINNQLRPVSEGNDTLLAPHQFVVDLSRTGKVVVNGKTAIELTDPNKSNYRACKMIIDALSEIDEENAELLFQHLATFMNQAIAGDMVEKITAYFLTDNPEILSVEGGKFFWDIKIDKNQVKVNLKSIFIASPMTDMETEEVKKIVVTTRTVTIPLNELKNITPDVPVENLVPNMRVVDHLSTTMSVDEYTATLSQYSPYEKETLSKINVGAKILQKKKIIFDDVTTSGLEIVKRHLQGKKIDTTPVSLKDQTGEHSISIPAQFASDIERIRSIKLENEKIAELGEEYDHYETVKAIVDACARVCGPEKALLAAQNIGRLMHQGTVADIAAKVTALDAYERRQDFEFTNVFEEGQNWEIKVGNKTLELTYRATIKVNPVINGKPEESGTRVVKRVIEIPFSELVDENQLTSDNPFPNTRVTDTFSKLIEVNHYANSLLESF